MSPDLTLAERQWVERVALRAAPMVAAGEPVESAIGRAIADDSHHVQSVAVAVIVDAKEDRRWGQPSRCVWRRIKRHDLLGGSGDDGAMFKRFHVGRYPARNIPRIAPVHYFTITDG